jgi:hypothetical protein
MDYGGLMVGPPTSPPEDTAFDRHDHEWHPVDDAFPVLEDGAAIFYEECNWAVTKTIDMGKYGTEEHAVGPECEASRRHRMEAARITADFGYGDVVLTGEYWSLFPEVVEAAFEAIETADDGDLEILRFDPDPNKGEFYVAAGGYEILYRAGADNTTVYY